MLLGHVEPQKTERDFDFMIQLWWSVPVSDIIPTTVPPVAIMMATLMVAVISKSIFIVFIFAIYIWSIMAMP